MHFFLHSLIGIFSFWNDFVQSSLQSLLAVGAPRQADLENRSGKSGRNPASNGKFWVFLKHPWYIHFRFLCLCGREKQKDMFWLVLANWRKLFSVWNVFLFPCKGCRNAFLYWYKMWRYALTLYFPLNCQPYLAQIVICVPRHLWDRPALNPVNK